MGSVSLWWNRKELARKTVKTESVTKMGEYNEKETERQHALMTFTFLIEFYKMARMFYAIFNVDFNGY